MMTEEGNVPLGLGMALVQNKNALKAFAAMTVPQQQDFIEGAAGVNSPEQMREYVARIGEKKDG